MTKPNVQLLVVSATYRAPRAAKANASGSGKMNAAPVSLQYASRAAFVQGLDDILAKPLLTLEQALVISDQ